MKEEPLVAEAWTRAAVVRTYIAARGDRPWGETVKEIQGHLQSAIAGGVNLKEIAASMGNPTQTSFKQLVGAVGLGQHLVSAFHPTLR